jgi:hypothetical protein
VISAKPLARVNSTFKQGRIADRSPVGLEE